MLTILLFVSSLALASSASVAGFDIPIPVGVDGVKYNLHISIPSLQNMSEQAKTDFGKIIMVSEKGRGNRLESY